jgi:hypothetical protein
VIWANRGVIGYYVLRLLGYLISVFRRDAGDSRPNPLDSLGVAAAVRRSKFEFDLTNRVTGSLWTLSSLSSSLKSPGVAPSSGNLKVPLVGVHGSGDPDVGDDRDIDASIPDARQSSAIRS